LRRQLNELTAALCGVMAILRLTFETNAAYRCESNFCLHVCKAQKLFISIKRPTPIAGPIRVAMTIMTKGFAIITLTPH
jgi:hypothetical protein